MKGINMKDTDFLLVRGDNEGGRFYALIPVSNNFKTDMAARSTCFWNAKKGIMKNLLSMSEDYPRAIFIRFPMLVKELLGEPTGIGRITFILKGTVKNSTIEAMSGRVHMSWGSCGFRWTLTDDAGDEHITSRIELGQILSLIPFVK